MTQSQMFWLAGMFWIGLGWAHDQLGLLSLGALLVAASIVVPLLPLGRKGEMSVQPQGQPGPSKGGFPKCPE